VLQNRVLRIFRPKRDEIGGGSEFLTAAVMNSSVFLGIMPCSPLEVNRCFG
jgi:hypothetical protein